MEWISGVTTGTMMFLSGLGLMALSAAMGLIMALRSKGQRKKMEKRMKEKY